MSRFNAVDMEIPDLEPNVELHTIKSSNKPRPFCGQHGHQQAITIGKFYMRVVGFIEMEQLR